ncbi:MAG: hypothetical protein HOG49_16380 [Candidatus Scalindua sp.]|nr:hypothetical protein [Candidatus Scalindua sp.]
MNGIPRNEQGDINVDEYREKLWYSVKDIEEKLPKTISAVKKNSKFIMRLKVAGGIISTICIALFSIWSVLA